jgi:ppGpp synthetase/RelA/SpoT-type nucleotidyltranferase
MDALVVDSRGEYSTLPYHKVGLWSRSSLEPTAGPTPLDQEPLSVSDRFDPPGEGYFRHLYHKHDPSQVEERFLNALNDDERGILARSISFAEQTADRLQRDLSDALASLEKTCVGPRPELVDLEYRVKTEASLARAFETARAQNGITSLSSFLGDQRDLTRFSVMVAENDYSAQVKATLQALVERGYEVRKYTNFWRPNARHNGLNVTLADPREVLVEVQFPTELSRRAGKQTHRYYETVRVRTTPAPLQVDAFLRILAVNDRLDLNNHQPTDLKMLGIDRAVDTTFATWYEANNVVRSQYERWLDSHGLSLEEMIRRHGLVAEKILQSQESDTNDSSVAVRLQDSDNVRRVESAGQPDRLPSRGRSESTSGDVGGGSQNLDVRTGDSGSIHIRPGIHDIRHGGGSSDSGADGSRRADGGTALRSGAGADVRGGRTDGLGDGPAEAEHRRQLNSEEPDGRRSDRRIGRLDPTGAVPPHVDPVALTAAQSAVRELVGPRSRALADVVIRLLDDHATHDHRLNLTDNLLNADRRARVIEVLNELADSNVVASFGSFDRLLNANAGHGSLFDPVADEVNDDADGNSRKNTFVEALKAADPARAVGADPTIGHSILLDEFALILSARALPVVKAEIRTIADAVGPSAKVTARAKTAQDLTDKVDRMTKDEAAPRPHYRVGEVIDAVGARITVADMAELAIVFEAVKAHFGTGDSGRILEIENMYASPKPIKPLYRVISMVISVEVDGKPYTFELQLTTERASVAADLDHNTLYKPYVPVSATERRTLRSVLKEAAALDQLETVTDA